MTVGEAAWLSGSALVRLMPISGFSIEQTADYRYQDRPSFPRVRHDGKESHLLPPDIA
jgi:hypothetical protein